MAPLTPFTPDLKVDESALRRQSIMWSRIAAPPWWSRPASRRRNTHYLSLDERRALIRSTIAFVDGRAPVMVGVSHASFKTASELAHERSGWARRRAVLAPLRSLRRAPTKDDLIAYFEAVAHETKLPITLYLNPGRAPSVPSPTPLRSPSFRSGEIHQESSATISRGCRG